MFVVNDIIRIVDAANEEVIERILWIDEGNVICYTISVFKALALPIKRKISDLELLHEEKLLSLMEYDPYGFIYQREDEVSDKYKNLRNGRWVAIQNIVLKEPEIYIREKRGALIKNAAVKSGKNKRLLYKYVVQYWQRGKVKNGLLPDYQNSGGGGKERHDKGKKLGRPRKFPAIMGEGIIITEEIKKVFQVSIKRYYHTTKKNPLATTFNLMLKSFFVEDYRYENGVKKPILMPQEKLPTFRQFQYWYEKTYKSEEKLRKRKGNRKYDLQHRAVLGTSVGELYGPGTKYQIDATVADVYLVSSYNRNWIIGRPVIYVVIDVFSRMVTGLYVGLEGPSWFGAMMALANTASEKVPFCKQYGVEISQSDWECHYLPQTLLADRGELEGYNVERLIKAFNIKVENTPPYRGDWKGIVEQHFRIIHSKVKPFLPGFVDKEATRGDRDYRLDATLTLEEFTAVIIRCVLYHNNHHWQKQYNQDEMSIKDEVPLIPQELWRWGIKNRSGKLRSYPENIVKMHLLPAANARVTYKGIEFKKMRYGCDKALKEGWFVEAREKSWKIPICFDPRNMEHIYLPNEDGRSYEVATLLNHQKKYQGKTIEEVEHLFASEGLKQQKYSHEETQKKVDLASDIEHIVRKAKKSTSQGKVAMSNNQKVKGIRDNRTEEKEENRKEEAFLLADANSSIQSSALPKEKDKELPPNEGQSKIELLRQKQKEKLMHARSRR